MTEREKLQQKIREIILKYTLPDALKPEYDGMTAHELAGIIIEAVNEMLAKAGEYVRI